MRLLPLVLLAAVAAGQQTNPMLAFADGFVLGLQKNANTQDTCATELHAYAGDGVAVVEDLIAASEGSAEAATELIFAWVKLQKAFSDYDGACNFPALLNSIGTLNTRQGWLDVFWRMYDNVDGLKTDLDNTKNCTQAPSVCGDAFGHVFSVLLDYTI